MRQLRKIHGFRLLMLGMSAMASLSFMGVDGQGKSVNEVNKIIGSSEDVAVISGNGNDVNFVAEGDGDAKIISHAGNDVNNATFNEGNVLVISGGGDDDNLIGLNKGQTTLDSGSGSDKNLMSLNYGITKLMSGPGNDQNVITDRFSGDTSVDCGPGLDSVIVVGDIQPRISKNCETVERIQ